MAPVRQAGASAASRRRQCLCASSSRIGLVRHKQCCLTLRSSRPTPAWHLARQALTVIIRLAGQAPHRRGRLSSNVRQHHVALKVLAIASGAAVAAKCEMPSSATFVHARCSKSGNAQVPRSALLHRQLRLQRFAAMNLCRSLRWYQSVLGAAATRKALPSFTAGDSGGLERRRQIAALAHQRSVGNGNACVLRALTSALSATNSAA